MSLRSCCGFRDEGARNALLFHGRRGDGSERAYGCRGDDIIIPAPPPFDKMWKGDSGRRSPRVRNSHWCSDEWWGRRSRPSCRDRRPFCLLRPTMHSPHASRHGLQCRSVSSRTSVSVTTSQSGLPRSPSSVRLKVASRNSVRSASGSASSYEKPPQYVIQ